MINSDSDDGPAALRAAIRKAAHEAVRVLTELLSSDDERVRLKAAAVLGRVGPVLSRPVPPPGPANGHELADAFSRAAIGEGEDREA